jgi:opacity protein-like surface antigen
VVLEPQAKQGVDVSFRTLRFLILLAAPASIAESQILQVPTSQAPTYWASLGIGLHQAQAVVDGTTGTRWEFANAILYRGSLERELRGGSTVGVTLATTQTPLRYVRAVPTTGSTCLSSCDATANVYSAMAQFSAGGGQGFSQLLQIGAGFLHYTNFREDAGGGSLEPDGDTDFSFSIGYGFSYGFTPRMQVFLMQDAGYSLHQREGLSGNQSSASQQYTTRLGFRAGLGGSTP